MIKKLISILMVIVTLLSMVMSFSSCSTQQNNSLTLGQWLGMVNNSFGMESYSQEEPYIKNVSKENEYFNTIQIAAEWDVIDRESTIDPNSALTWKDALVTLVNVGNFTKANATEDEKIDYAINNFDSRIRKYWMNRQIDVASATQLLVIAQEKWANKTYKEPISKVEYSENVVDFSDVKQSDYTVSESGNILVGNDIAGNLEVGKVVVLPSSENNATPNAYKIKEIKTNGEYVEVVPDTDLELGDVVDELYIEDTFTPDLTQAAFYDGNGNLLSGDPSANIAPQSYSSVSDPMISTLAYSSNETVKTIPLASKTTFSFEVDGCKVEVAMKSDGLSAKIEMPMSEKDKSWIGYYEAEISNFEVTNKIDYSWFTLHSAEVKVDYTTKNTIGVKKKFVDEKAVYAPKWSNGNGHFLSNLKNAVWKNNDGKGAKTIKIGSIKVASVGVASFSVDVYAKCKVDGTIEISCSETGCKGIEYKNGNCRVINTSDKDTDVKFKCKAEGTVSVAPTVNAFGFAIIGLKAEVGLGAEASLTLHLADAGNHLLQEMSTSDLPPEVVDSMEVEGLSAEAEEIRKYAEEQGGTFECETSTVDLHLDRCFDINIYFILKVGIEEETLAGKLLKGTKIKVEWEIFGSKNAKICNLHVENGDWATAFSNIGFFTNKDQCTLKYVPFDDAKEDEKKTETEDNNNSEVTVGEVLVITDMKVVLEVGSTKIISVVQIPKGYELKDVVCSSSDKSVATIDKNGVIKGVGEGSTTIIVQTSDGKYSCACSITIESEGSGEFTPLNFQSVYNNNGMVYAA